MDSWVKLNTKMNAKLNIKAVTQSICIRKWVPKSQLALFNKTAGNWDAVMFNTVLPQEF